MTPAEQQEILDRAGEAKRLLDNPLLKTAFDDVEKQLFENALSHASRNDQDRIERDRLLEAVKIARKVRAILVDHVQTGEIVKKDIREIQSGRKPFF